MTAQDAGPPAGRPHGRGGQPGAHRMAVTTARTDTDERLPLLPAQRRFLEFQPAEAHHCNVSALLTLPAGADAETLRDVMTTLVERHDGLRTVMTDTGPRTRTARLVTPGRPVLVERLDLRAVADGALDAAIDQRAAPLQRSLDLRAWPLFRVACLELGAARGRRALLTVHHLLADLVSLRLLAAELDRLLRAAADGSPAPPPTRGASIQQLARRLAELAAGTELRGHADRWCELVAPADPLPLDHPKPNGLLEDEEVVEITLDARRSRQILTGAGDAHRHTVRTRLTAAAVWALGQHLGVRAARVTLLGHGRAGVMRPLDVTHTIGWLACRYPVTLPVARSPADTLAACAERLAQVPSGGETYGILRYLCPDTSTTARLAALESTDVLVNWLGTLPGGMRRPGSVHGVQRSRRSRRQWVHEVTGAAVDGRLRLRWAYDRHQYDRDTVRHLAASAARALGA